MICWPVCCKKKNNVMKDGSTAIKRLWMLICIRYFLLGFFKCSSMYILIGSNMVKSEVTNLVLKSHLKKTTKTITMPTENALWIGQEGMSITGKCSVLLLLSQNVLKRWKVRDRQTKKERERKRKKKKRVDVQSRMAAFFTTSSCTCAYGFLCILSDRNKRKIKETTQMCPSYYFIQIDWWYWSALIAVRLNGINFHVAQLCVCLSFVMLNQDA